MTYFRPAQIDADHARLDDTRRANMLVAACHAGILLLIASLALRLAFRALPPWPWLGAACIICAGMVAGPLALRRWGSVPRAAVFPIAGLTLALPLLILEGGGLDSPVVAIVPTIPVVATFFIGPRCTLAFSVVLALELVGTALAQRAGLLPSTSAPLAVKAALVVTFLGATGTIARVYSEERAAAELRLRELAKQLYDNSIRDPLTGVFNRRHFAERLDVELAFARRHGTALAAMMLDVDHFKAVNDRFGHRAGDAVLCELAAVARRTLRTEDLLARYGGEEFVVLLRDVDLEGARAAAERLRLAVQSHRFEHEGASIPVTISVGCASAQGRQATEAALLSQADTRLYVAKSAGRNCVVADRIAAAQA